MSHKNEAVHFSINKDAILIKPIVRKEYSLEELLEGVTEHNLHGEFDVGAPAGKEI
ncbi:AbrB/MazE/SpoVT family DNA-binding domain-containing protein (fragment) [Candidatus Desulfarcum epimagneticum]|uniref:AbrB/MazE/SpoVT family DNA-binding domain-containing protein n=1 Tax=uncultured Desulfobacteraceae bacterium TaxID=218296 RepID=A0A484HFF7_9BACT